MKIIGALFCNGLIPEVMALHDVAGVGQVLLCDGVNSLGYGNGCRGRHGAAAVEVAVSHLSPRLLAAAL